MSDIALRPVWEYFPPHFPSIKVMNFSNEEWSVTYPEKRKDGLGFHPKALVTEYGDFEKILRICCDVSNYFRKYQRKSIKIRKQRALIKQRLKHLRPN